MTPRPDIFFLPAAGGEQRLCLFHAPAGAPRSKILYLHPFAEEMNKSRRMAALACRALAEAGHAVLQIDLRGCGDSSADFGDASWADWQADVRLGLAELDRRVPNAPLWLWGLRAGALLAAEAATVLRQPCSFLYWQPTLSGRLVLQQFLRLRLAAEMSGGGAKGLMETLKGELAAGHPVEVAGYVLNPALSQGLDAARLAPPPAMPAARIVWRELGSEGSEFGPASTQNLQAWRDAGWQVDATLVAGPAFWATTEIEVAPALLERTVESL